jgi:uncharacterized membrane protein YvlD (DUF360 family)
LIFGVVNVVIRPIIVLLSLPLEIITLGLFTFVINAFMLLLTSWIAQGMGVGFRVDGFLAALVAALIITIVSFVLSRVLQDPVRTGHDVMAGEGGGGEAKASVRNKSRSPRTSARERIRLVTLPSPCERAVIRRARGPGRLHR